jgi:hypothetical protein
MSAADGSAAIELVVAEDGSIAARQLEPLGLAPGTHLRVVRSEPGEGASTLAGSLPGFPDLEWEDFERGSELARRDVESA